MDKHIYTMADDLELQIWQEREQVRVQDLDSWTACRECGVPLRLGGQALHECVRQASMAEKLAEAVFVLVMVGLLVLACVKYL